MKFTDWKELSDALNELRPLLEEYRAKSANCVSDDEVKAMSRALLEKMKNRKGESYSDVLYE